MGEVLGVFELGWSWEGFGRTRYGRAAGELGAMGGFIGKMLRPGFLSLQKIQWKVLKSV